MRHIAIRCSLLGVSLLCGTCNNAIGASSQMPTQAYIRASEHGQALLLSRLGECYAVTPKHVMGGDLYATLVGGRSTAPQGDGDLLQTFGYDLSILHVNGSLAQDCGGQLTNSINLDNVLGSNSAANVASVNEDGSLTRRNVTINDVGLLYIRIRPDGSDDQLFKGLSGSLLLVANKPAGILMSVDSETGEGRVLRYDRAIETLLPFFNLPATGDASEKNEGASQLNGTNSQVSVVSWNSPPLSGDHRAANLIDAAGKETTWYAQATKYPVELVIELPGNKAHVVNSVVLEGGGVEPKQRLPRDFEILVSSTARGNWVSVISATYFMNETDKRVSFMPVRARQIMLRIYSNWGDKDAVGLAGLKIPRSR